MPGGLGHLYHERAGRRVEPLGLVAIGIAAAITATLVMASTQITLPFQAHRQLEHAGKRRPNAASPIGSQMFQHGLNGRILNPVHSLVSTVSRNSMEYQNGQPVLRHASARASRFQRQRISRPQVTLPSTQGGRSAVLRSTRYYYRYSN